jgi:hypothetical protein
LDADPYNHGHRRNTGSFILIFACLPLIAYQLNAMTYAFHTLLKDKEIIAAEVMNEYNQGVR